MLGVNGASMDSKEQWGTVVFIDTATFKGFVDDKHVALQLKNSHHQYDVYSLAPEVMQIFTAARFQCGKELLIRYRVGNCGHALVVDIRKQAAGERLHVTAGTVVEIWPEHKVVRISNGGEVTEYNLDKGVYRLFAEKIREGQTIVAYFRYDWFMNIITAFE